MPPITNDFSWSISRAKVFAQCRRRYYYCYYGSWMGWDFQAPPEARLIYRLKQILTLPMWAGKITHRTLEIAIRRIQQGRPMDLEAMQKLARKMLNAEWRESETRQWMRHPKKYVNLFDHYYGREVTAERRGQLRERVFSALEGFFDMGCAETLRALKPEDWLCVEDLSSFDCGGIKVWAVLDCAFRANGALEIYDWKTGAPSEDAEPTDQLICYALYAMQTWQAPLESIRVALAFLPSRQASAFQITPEQIIEFRERLYASAAEMAACLADPAKNIAREEDFPRTGEEGACAECEYRELCFNTPAA